MNGRALPFESREMKAFVSYMRWVSAGIPDGAKLIGAGTLQIKEPTRAADSARGAEIYGQICAACRGSDGLGQRAQNGLGYQFPPLWGPDSFNNGAGMSRLLTAAAYALHNMPLGSRFDSPVLTDEQAYDVAGYIVSQNRPEKADLDKDFPVRLQKPVDAAVSQASLIMARSNPRVLSNGWVAPYMSLRTPQRTVVNSLKRHPQFVPQTPAVVVADLMNRKPWNAPEGSKAL
jgi:cytochrome c